MEKFLLSLGFRPWWASIPKEHREAAAREHVSDGFAAVFIFILGSWLIIGGYTWAAGLAKRYPHTIADNGVQLAHTIADALAHPGGFGK